MSGENVEVFRRAIDAWNLGDLDTTLSYFDANAVVVTDPTWMEPGPFEGRDSIRAWYEGLREAWEGRNELVITDIFEVGDTLVVARIDWQVRGRTSGIDTDLDLTCVITVEGGKIIHQQWFFDHGKALEAARLRE
jgi:hypothetical protein